MEGFIDRYSSDNVIIAGDFNVDFNHTGINHQNLVNFMNNLHLVSADQLSASGISYTYMRDDGQAFTSDSGFEILVLGTEDGTDTPKYHINRENGAATFGMLMVMNVNFEDHGTYS